MVQLKDLLRSTQSILVKVKSVVNNANIVDGLKEALAIELNNVIDLVSEGKGTLLIPSSIKK